VCPMNVVWEAGQWGRIWCSLDNTEDVWLLIISKIVLWQRPEAQAGNSITQSLSKYIFMRLNYSLLLSVALSLAMTMLYVHARLSKAFVSSFIHPACLPDTKHRSVYTLKIELICKFMCILLFHPYHLMLLASLLMDFLNQFNT
jgi:hypothetical protein